MDGTTTELEFFKGKVESAMGAPPSRGSHLFEAPRLRQLVRALAEWLNSPF